MKTNRQLLAAAILMALACTANHAAEMSASPDKPVVDGGDIANLNAAVVTSDKWWPENSSGAGSAKGQTFTTGDLKVLLKSITYQVDAGQQATATKIYKIRVGSILGNVFTEMHTEMATQDFTWNGGEYMTWAFETPVLLEADTSYAIDIGLISSTSGWPSGIPYINVTGDGYDGGWRYSSGQNGLGTPQLNLDTNRDRIFHIDLEYPPQGFQFIIE
ncbi:MAG: hypothetical protein ACI9UA_000136 [Pseudoalteromonas tetraodonis]|jgi:hypothetical protein